MTTPNPADFQSDALKNWLGSYQGQKFDTPQFDNPDLKLPPNFEKLTPMERSIYSALPRLGKSTFGQTLEKFNNTWAGKALQYLDVGAEGLERGIGLMIQMANGGITQDQLKAAWYAGSLTYDTGNLPMLKRDQNGNVVGIKMGSDLPDVAGLVEARNKLQTLIEGGVDPKQALTQVRDDYYKSLGALAFRATMHDAILHMGLDPINIIAGAVKPIEALKLRAIAGAGEKVSLTTAELTAKAAEMTAEAERLTKAGAAATDIAHYTEEARQLTELAGDVSKQINTGDRIAMWLTGGDTFRPTKLSQAIERNPLLRVTPLGWGQLTPESKVKELISLIGDHFGMTVINRLGRNTNAEREVADAIRRVSKGSTGIEFGHSMVSLQGRTVQSYVAMASAKVDAALAAFEATTKEQELIADLGAALEMKGYDLIELANSDPDKLMRVITNKAATNADLAARLQSGELTAQRIDSLAKMKGVAYNRDYFFAQVVDILEDTAAEQAMLQFGVKAKGLGTRWSDAVKSAEGLAFLRLNPAYPVKNAVNNEFTMLARGVWGMWSADDVKTLFGEHAWLPSRLRESFQTELVASDVQQLGMGEYKSNMAMQRLEEALRGGNYGGPEKMQAFFKGISLGNLDSAALGQKAEKWASMRATMTGIKQYLHRHWTPPSLTKRLSTTTVDAIEAAHPGMMKEVENFIRASEAMDHKLEGLLDFNLHFNADSILDEASKFHGFDVRELLGDEVLDAVKNGLPKAMQDGTAEEFLNGVRTKLRTHVADLVDKRMEIEMERVKAMTIAGGPQMFYHKMGDAHDLLWSAHIEHSQRMPEVTRLAREAVKRSDFETANVLWSRIAADDEAFFGRAMKRVDAYLQGMEEASQELATQGIKLPIPPEVRKGFQQWRQTWEDFYTFRNTERKAFFDARLQGKEYRVAWDQLNAELDAKYADAIAMEDNLMRGVDDVVAGAIDDPGVRQAFTNARDTMAEMRTANKEKVVAIIQQTRSMPADERAATWDQFWSEQNQFYTQMRDLDKATTQLLSGDPNALQLFSQAAPRETLAATTATTGAAGAAGAATTPVSTLDIANELGIPTVTKSGARSDARVRNIVAKYVKEHPEALQQQPEFKLPKLGETLDEASAPIVRQALEDWAQRNGKSLVRQPAPAKSGVSPTFLTDVKGIIKEEMPTDLGLDLVVYGRTNGALDSIYAAARTQATKKPMFIHDLPPAIQDEVMRGLEGVKGEFATGRYNAVRFGEWRRDSALLNYNRRTNFDAHAGTMMPFVFWTTGTIQKWAVESIDRPAALGFFLRTRKFMETAGMQEDGSPSRTNKSIRIKMPFVPEWMGDQFVDPLRFVMPFDALAQPFEQMQQVNTTLDGRAERLLDDYYSKGNVTQQQYLQAQQHQGPIWDQMVAEAQRNDENLKYDAWDFATAMSSPHAPIMWAYNAARGHPEEIGPFAPASRIMRNAFTMLGVEDYTNSPWNVEGKVRKAIGLPAFDKWDDYRVDRAISDLVGSGDFSIDQVKEAMYLSSLVQKGQMDPEQAKQMSEAYKEGVKRSNQEYAGGGPVGFGLSLLGLNVKSVPEGEMNLRKLTAEFGRAYELKEAANKDLQGFIDQHPDMTREEAIDAWGAKNPDKARDADKLNEFFDKHPEYEARLGLFDKPEQRIQKFLVDQVWATYNSMPDLNKRELRDQLGVDFNDLFLNKDTRAYDQIRPEQLAVWLKLMGGSTPGILTAKDEALIDLQRKKLTDPETAYRVQVFYDGRKDQFPNYWEVQNGYYAQSSKAARRQYLGEHPELKAYWDWRRGFMFKNPDLVRYLTDSPDAIAKAEKQFRQEGAVPTRQELQIQIDPDTQELLQLYKQTGQQLPPAVMRELFYLSYNNGLSIEQMLNIAGY